MYADATPPLKVIAWDIKTENGMTTGCLHFGTKESCRRLARRKKLPTYEELWKQEQERINRRAH